MQVKFVYKITVIKLIINLVSIAFLVIIFTSWWCYKNHLVISLAVAVHEHPSPKLYISIIGLNARTFHHNFS